MTTTRVLVVGDVMRDIVVRPDGALRRGTDRSATIRSSFGGSGANQAAWLARFGVPVRFLGCVGRDDHAFRTQHMRQHGIEPALAAHPDLPTGTLVAMIDPDGERSFLTDRGANDGLTEALRPAGLLAEIGHVHVSGYALVGQETRSTVLSLLEEARQAGLPVSIDPGSAGFIQDVGAERFLGWCAGMGLCVANEAEAEALVGPGNVGEQLGRLGQLFGRVVIKQGERGACARPSDGAVLRRAAPLVEVVDSIGAGDAFFAAFLAAQLAGRTTGDCLADAVSAGAAAVTTIGGWPTG